MSYRRIYFWWKKCLRNVHLILKKHFFRIECILWGKKYILCMNINYKNVLIDFSNKNKIWKSCVGNFWRLNYSHFYPFIYLRNWTTHIYYNNGVATYVSLSSIHIFPSLRHSCSIITYKCRILWSTNQCDKNENLHWHCQRHVSHWVNYSFLCNQSTLIWDLPEFIIICLGRNLSEEDLLTYFLSSLHKLYGRSNGTYRDNWNCICTVFIK